MSSELLLLVTRLNLDGDNVIQRLVDNCIYISCYSNYVAVLLQLRDAAESAIQKNVQLGYGGCSRRKRWHPR